MEFNKTTTFVQSAVRRPDHAMVVPVTVGQTPESAVDKQLNAINISCICEKLKQNKKRKHMFLLYCPGRTKIRRREN